MTQRKVLGIPKVGEIVFPNVEVCLETEVTPKVYIAGAITGNPVYEKEFKDMELELRSKGYAPLNPVKPLGFTYKEYIDMGLNELMRCDAIVVLLGWEKSKGARLEVEYARAVGIPVFENVQSLEDYYMEVFYGDKR